ncbi:MAG: hypothetical protein WD069_00215 [Planctomycetales bacterium]
MSRLHLANLDFEHRLPDAQRGTRWTLTEAARRLNAELACVWSGIAADGDLVRLPAPIEPGFFDHLVEQELPRLHPVFDGDRRSKLRSVEAVNPWGWTDDVRRWADRRGLPHSAPQQDVVARANARGFSTEMERELGVELPGSAIVSSFDDLTRALAGLRSHLDRWVVKAEFGMSARERMIGMGSAPDRRTADWVRLRVARDGAVYFEPWVERLEEVGVHFTIPPDGPPRFDGVAAMLSDAWGRYRGSRFERDPVLETRWRPAIEAGTRAAARLAELGYFGPLGIDACRYRDAEGAVRLRPLQDVNARWTMGALARGFRRLLRPGEFGTWLHVPWPTDSPDGPRRAFEALQARLPAGTRAIRTSPYEAGNRPNAHGTLVLIAGTVEVRDAVEELAEDLPRYA